VELEIDRIFGLPAHPLFAHAPVVLVPLTALLALTCAISRRQRERLGWLAVGLALASLVFVQLAIGSGEALEDAVNESPLVEDHAGMADTLLPIAAGLFVAVTAMVVTDRLLLRRRGPDGPRAGARWLVAALAVAAVVSGALATAWAVRAGHSGAKAVWDDPDRPMVRSADP
jgi:hypothetical protein